MLDERAPRFIGQFLRIRSLCNTLGTTCLALPRTNVPRSYIKSSYSFQLARRSLNLRNMKKRNPSYFVIEPSTISLFYLLGTWFIVLCLFLFKLLVSGFWLNDMVTRLNCCFLFNVASTSRSLATYGLVVSNFVEEIGVQKLWGLFLVLCCNLVRLAFV